MNMETISGETKTFAGGSDNCAMCKICFYSLLISLSLQETDMKLVKWSQGTYSNPMGKCRKNIL